MKQQCCSSAEGEAVQGGRVLRFPTRLDRVSQSSAVASVDGRGSLSIRVDAPNLKALWETIQRLDEIIQEERRANGA